MLGLGVRAAVFGGSTQPGELGFASAVAVRIPSEPFTQRTPQSLAKPVLGPTEDPRGCSGSAAVGMYENRDRCSIIFCSYVTARRIAWCRARTWPQRSGQGATPAKPRRARRRP
jgi:hypothetical protein